MGGFRDLLAYLFGWLSTPGGRACITLADALATVVTPADATTTAVTPADAATTTITLADAKC
jgi:hypothetical protein